MIFTATEDIYCNFGQLKDLFDEGINLKNKEIFLLLESGIDEENEEYQIILIVQEKSCKLSIVHEQCTWNEIRRV